MLDRTLSDELKGLLGSSVGGDKAIDEIYIILYRILDELHTINSVLPSRVAESTPPPYNVELDTALIAGKIIKEIVSSDLSLSAPELKINYEELASTIAREQFRLFEKAYGMKKTLLHEDSIPSSGCAFNLLINKIKGVFFGSFK